MEYPKGLSNLYDPIKYALAEGGKRLRPVLLLAVNDAFGGNREECLWPALGVEIFHNFTLVHDDIMDNADLRRGRPTVYRKWDMNTAILSGDTMTSMAFKCASGCPPMFLPEVIDRFCTMTRLVYEGQQIDADFETAENVSFQQYLQMIMGKTSALIAYPCAIGALLSGTGQEDIADIFNFGNLLGIAFQMQDDYLDVYGDPETFGKQIGGDILNDKKTWLYIIAKDHDHDGEFARIIADKTLQGEAKIKAVTKYYDKIGLRTQGEKIIESYTSDALAHLHNTTMGEAEKAWFDDFVNKLLHRTK